MHFRAMQCNEIQCSLVNCSKKQCSAVPSSTLQFTVKDERVVNEEDFNSLVLLFKIQGHARQGEGGGVGGGWRLMHLDLKQDAGIDILN